MITFLKRFLLIIAALTGLSSCYREVVVYKDSPASINNNENPQIYQNFRTQNPMLYSPYQNQKDYYHKYDHDYYYVPPRNYGKYESKI